MNIFKDKTTELPGNEFSVHTMMCPDDARDRAMQLIDVRKFEKADVENVIRSRKGHGY